MSDKSENYGRDVFWAAWGVVTFFFMTPLVKMVLDDSQSLYLGAWDWFAFSLFLVLTFAVIPALVAGTILITNKLSKRVSWFLLAFSVAYLVAVQVHFFYLSRRFPNSHWDADFSRALFIGTLAFGWWQRKFLIETFKTIALLTPVALVLFAWNAHPSIKTSGKEITKSAVQPTDNQYPIFFFSFEKLVSNYFTDAKGNIRSDMFPNVARFTNDADYYANTYSNSMATVMAIQSMYSGDISTSYYGIPEWRVRKVHLRRTLGANKKSYLLLDVLEYADPATDTQVHSIDTNAITRVLLIKGWYCTYLKTNFPDAILDRTGLNNWEFDPRKDLWKDTFEDGLAGYQSRGRRQLQALKDILTIQGGRPNLYIMHNWLSDEPAVIKSELMGDSRAEINHEIEKDRPRLKDFDTELGKLMDFLKEKDLYDRSMIVVVGDTGYDKGIYKKGGDETLPASPELLKIYLAMKRPGQKEGRRFDGVMRQIDMLPTIAEGCGMDSSTFDIEGKALIDPSQKPSLAQRPLLFHITVPRGMFLYDLTSEKGPLKRR